MAMVIEHQEEMIAVVEDQIIIDQIGATEIIITEIIILIPRFILKTPLFS